MPRVRTYKPTDPTLQNATDEQEQEVEATIATQTLSLSVELEVPEEIGDGYNDARAPKPSLNNENARKLKQITLALIEQQATITCGGNQYNETTGERPRKLVQRPQDALTWLIEQAKIEQAKIEAE